MVGGGDLNECLWEAKKKWDSKSVSCNMEMFKEMILD